MQRLKSGALLILLSLSLTQAWAELMAPQWYEFCPPEYQYPQTSQPQKKMSLGAKIAIVPLALICPIGVLAVMGGKNLAESNRREKAQYWAQRKIQFDNEVATCGETSTDKAMCYLQIRQMESQKNQALGQYELQKQQLSTMRIQAVAAQSQATAAQEQVNALHQQTQAIQQLHSAPRYYNCQTFGNSTSCNGY